MVFLEYTVMSNGVKLDPVNELKLWRQQYNSHNCSESYFNWSCICNSQMFVVWYSFHEKKSKILFDNDVSISFNDHWFFKQCPCLLIWVEVAEVACNDKEGINERIKDMILQSASSKRLASVWMKRHKTWKKESKEFWVFFRRDTHSKTDLVNSLFGSSFQITNQLSDLEEHADCQ